MQERKENLNYENKTRYCLRDMISNEHNYDGFGTLGTILMNYNKKLSLAYKHY